MATVLLVSKQGDGVPIALRLAQEGHVVKVWIKDPEFKESLKGYKNPRGVGQVKALEQYDLILFDMVGLGSLAEKMKKEGRPVLGGGLLNDKLELDRSYGAKVIQKLTKAEVPKTVSCSSKEELLKVLGDSSSPQVVKPEGNKATHLTLVGDEGNETLKSISKGPLGDLLVPCIIQEKVEGIEVSTEGWFDGKGWVGGCFNHTLEKKRLMEGDKGPNTGCMGNVVWSTNPERDEIVKEVLLPLKPLLERANYVGPLDANCIVQEEKIYFLEFTARFGYDAIQAFTEVVREGLFDLLWKGSLGEEIGASKDYGIAVRLSMPPYPFSEGVETLRGVKVVEFDKEASKHLFLADVQMGPDGPVMAGVDGVIGCATAYGSSVEEARRRVYRTVKNVVRSPDVQFREDIGLEVEEQIEKLKTWGWIDSNA